MAQLEAQVAEQQEELNKQPVVIDANGVEVGTFVGEVSSSSDTPEVMFEIGGLPLFTLRVEVDRLRGERESIYFESTDCSGTPLVERTAS